VGEGVLQVASSGKIFLLLYSTGLFGLFGLDSQSNSSFFRTNSQNCFGPVQFSLPTRVHRWFKTQKSNKTERFAVSFDFDLAISSTYDECRSGRSILLLHFKDHFVRHHFVTFEALEGQNQKHTSRMLAGVIFLQT
jgi:hypothetical protein